MYIHGHIKKYRKKNLMEFHEKLQVIRKNMALSQEKMAELLGIHQSEVSHYEVGRRKPSFAILVQLSDIVQKNNIPISLL